jgi:circadian clock protein KaiB
MAERKKKTAPVSRTREYEEALKAADGTESYVLRLYISGATPKSMRAIEHIKRLCETRLKGRYDLEIVDVYQQPDMVAADQVVAAPTLIKQLPLPVRQLIGDLSSEEHVLRGLDLIKR